MNSYSFGFLGTLLLHVRVAGLGFHVIWMPVSGSSARQKTASTCVNSKPDIPTMFNFPSSPFYDEHGEIEVRDEDNPMKYQSIESIFKIMVNNQVKFDNMTTTRGNVAKWQPTKHYEHNNERHGQLFHRLYNVRLRRERDR